MAARTAPHMGLQEGQVVLDLGHGTGASPRFFASHHGAAVVKADRPLASIAGRDRVE
jgi:cyclopropane fatty-acyl-phospholipid synthase-like methyltransferase